MSDDLVAKIVSDIGALDKDIPIFVTMARINEPLLDKRILMTNSWIMSKIVGQSLIHSVYRRAAWAGAEKTKKKALCPMPDASNGSRLGFTPMELTHFAPSIRMADSGMVIFAAASFGYLQSTIPPTLS